MRAFVLCCAAIVALSTSRIHAQGEGAAPLALLDVPFISQSEALCGGAAAAMILRYWGEREITAQTFAHLVDRSAAGIRTDALTGELSRRGWTAIGISGSESSLRAELARGRPVLTLIEDRPGTYHYVVLLGSHDRGVIFHDPARGPFVVMSPNTFTERWEAAGRWMAVVVPSPSTEPRASTPSLPAAFTAKAGACEQTVAEGVRLAQANDIAGAERVLAEAVACPAATRELAGIRVIQERWAEAEDLAAAAIAGGDADTYTWKVLATSRFLQNDRQGALDAWNQAGEPRLDLVRIDGLARTRHRVVEELIGLRSGELLTAESFMRARRRLTELPSAAISRLDYVPVTGGFAEVRGVVAERPVVPRGRLELAALGLIAAATREVTLGVASPTGGGERFWGGWRFWPNRMRVAVGVDTPAPWGGVLTMGASSERQPFSDGDIPAAERVSAQIGIGDWVTSGLRWNADAGVDRWNGADLRPRVAGALRFVSFDDRMNVELGASGWPGANQFATTAVSVGFRSSATRRGLLWTLRGTAGAVALGAPIDLWMAGDTGHARSTLLRAHPLLDDGQLRVERLGRRLLNGSGELQFWRSIRGPLAGAVGIFGDAARTSERHGFAPRTDVDLGIGARFAATGLPGLFRIDVARGLRDAAHVLSVAYEP